MESLTWPTKGRNLNQCRKPRQNLWIVLSVFLFPLLHNVNHRGQGASWTFSLNHINSWLFKGLTLHKQAQILYSEAPGKCLFMSFEASVPEGRTWPLAFAADWILMSCKLFEGSTLSSCLALWHVPKWAYHLGCFTAWHIVFFFWKCNRQKCSLSKILMSSALLPL